MANGYVVRQPFCLTLMPTAVSSVFAISGTELTNSLRFLDLTDVSTMSGEFVSMTPFLAKQVFQEAVVSDSNLLKLLKIIKLQWNYQKPLFSTISL